MRIRRIFRPSPAARLRAPLAMVAGAAALALLVSAAVPHDMFGSAPRAPALSAAADGVRVLDGGTLRVGEQVLRLQGVQVPDRGQATCRGPAGPPQDCGAAAAEALARLVAGRDVVCQVEGRDRPGRGLGRCEAGGVELGAALVAGGWAVAEPGAAESLAAAETAARQAGRGLWSAGWPGPASRRRGS